MDPYTLCPYKRSLIDPLKMDPYTLYPYKRSLIDPLMGALEDGPF